MDSTLSDSENDGGMVGRTSDSSDLTTRRLVRKSTDAKPRDTWNLAYIFFVLAGAGFLFPYNSYISAIDYFEAVYPDEKFAFLVTAVYFYVTCPSVFLNTLIIRLISLRLRIRLSYILFLIALVTVLAVNWQITVEGTAVTFGLTLFTLALVSFACGVQQASYYGFVGQLPRRYVQAVMTGESVAGLVVSIDRVITKAAISDCRQSSLVFFGLSIAFVVFCAVSHEMIYRSPLVVYHLGLSSTAEATSPEKYTPLKEKDEELIEMQTTTQRDESVGGKPQVSLRKRLADGISVWLSIGRRLWLYMLAIGSAYFLTLLIFPGLLSEIHGDHFKNNWLPVILISLFNFFDFIGKLISFWHYDWRPHYLVLASLLRFLLLPLLLFCVLPCSAPLFSTWTPYTAMALSSILGITNGYFGCMSMVLAPSKVEPDKRELAGNLMTFVLLFGLAAGASFAFLLNYLTGTEHGNMCFSNSTQNEFNCTLT
eukprot:m.148023 g.148023  ORF g.148023 m.148023 type:complete len:482 (+) comp38488_c0_seq4:23-1468(+)